MDGFIADTSDAIGSLFDWHANPTLRSLASAPINHSRGCREHGLSARAPWASVRAVVIGRHLFDLTNGYDGRRRLQC